MIFTPEEIQQLFNIIDYRLARVVADVLGRDFLTPQDESLLKQFGFDFKEEIKHIPPYYQAFIFGRLAGILSPDQLNTLNYGDVKEHVEKDQYQKLTKREKAEYAAAATRTYGYIKGMGDRVKKTLGNSVSEEEIKNAVEERRIEELSVIKKEHERGVLERRSVQAIVSSIGSQLKDWNRDWGRIVETEMENIFLLGVAQTIMEEHGSDALVYKDVFPGACSHCRHLYTTGGSGSEPRIFKLSSLIANGDNIGRKARDWKPVVGATHPYCFNSPYIEIKTFEGVKYICDIKVGDIVLTQQDRYKRVVNVFKRRMPADFKHGVFDIYYLIEDETAKGGWREDGLHRITGNHEVFVNGKKKQVKHIKPGDLLQTRKGLKVRVKFLLEIPKENYGEYLYNFEVEGDHSYYAENIAVSNCRCLLRYLPKGYVWDEESHSFRPPKDYKPRVERKSKVYITVGNKKFTV